MTETEEVSDEVIDGSPRKGTEASESETDGSELSESVESEPFEFPFDVPVEIELSFGEVPQIYYFDRELKTLLDEQESEEDEESEEEQPNHSLKPPQVVQVTPDLMSIKKSDPLAHVIANLEARCSRYGAPSAPKSIVRKKQAGDSFYQADDDFLDDEEVEYQSDSEGELDPAEFKSVPGDYKFPEDENQTAKDEDGWDMFGDRPDWRALLVKLDDKKRATFRESMQVLDDALYIAGSTRQRKLRLLKEAVAVVRRLLPKIPKIQNVWKRAFVVLVEEAPVEEIKLDVFETYWEAGNVTAQREEISQQRDEILKTVDEESAKDLSETWKKGEALTYRRGERIFGVIGKLYEFWTREEECFGRQVPVSADRQKPSQFERRFATHVQQSIPGISEQFSLVAVRIALYGNKKSTRSQTVQSSADTDEEAESEALPMKIYLYKKSVLLDVKLNEVFSLSKQSVTVTDKAWEGATKDYPSLVHVFDSFQQRFTRKQDRQALAAGLDVWKLFCYKSGDEYLPLYDAIQKSTSAIDWFFVDRLGYPVYLPSLALARAAEVKAKEGRGKSKEERKVAPYSEEFWNFRTFNAADFEEIVEDAPAIQDARQDEADDGVQAKAVEDADDDDQEMNVEDE